MAETEFDSGGEFQNPLSRQQQVGRPRDQPQMTIAMRLCRGPSFCQRLLSNSVSGAHRLGARIQARREAASLRRACRTREPRHEAAPARLIVGAAAGLSAAAGVPPPRLHGANEGEPMLRTPARRMCCWSTATGSRKETRILEKYSTATAPPRRRHGWRHLASRLSPR